MDQSKNPPPGDSDEVPSSRRWPLEPDLPNDDRLYLVRTKRGRWCAAAIAATMALPASAGQTADSWEDIFDLMHRLLLPIVDRLTA